jgi:hypothetical protein
VFAAISNPGIFNPSVTPWVFWNEPLWNILEYIVIIGFVGIFIALGSDRWFKTVSTTFMVALVAFGGMAITGGIIRNGQDAAVAMQRAQYTSNVSKWLYESYDIASTDKSAAKLVAGKVLAVDFNGEEVQVTIVPRADEGLAVRRENGSLLPAND